MTKRFDELGLSQAALDAVADLGYTDPTPVQEQAIPLVLQGRDVCAAAATGTGKTAAFLLPILCSLDHATEGTGPRMLVVTPTRELAQQIADVCKVVSARTGHSHLTVYGGTRYDKQIKALKRGVDILIATPGRLNDLRDRGAIALADIDVLVVDEADRMLDMGFWPAMKTIIAETPKNRQTMLFSATLDRRVMKSVGGILTDPVMVEISHRGDTAENVEQYLMPIQHKNKFDLLCAVLQEKGDNRVIVFCRTKNRTEDLATMLTKTGYAAESIHSDKSQYKRQRALDRFAKGKANVLVATDVLARGIDVPSVDYVVNYDLPDMAEDYVHRIGRTGRAGESGYAITFVTRETRNLLRDIERLIGTEIPIMELSTYDIDTSVLTAKEKQKHKHVRQRDIDRALAHQANKAGNDDYVPAGPFHGLEGWHGDVKRVNERVQKSKKKDSASARKHETKRDKEYGTADRKAQSTRKPAKGRDRSKKVAREESFETAGERREIRGGAHKKTYKAKRDGMQTRPKANQAKPKRVSDSKGKGKGGKGKSGKSGGAFEKYYKKGR